MIIIKILNLHGLYGKSQNTAYSELKKYFTDIFSPSYMYESLEPNYVLSNHINNDYDLIVGTSFGGFYAGLIGTYTNTKVIAINPAIPAHLYIPILVPDYKYTDILTALFEDINFDNITAILGDNDETINSAVTAQYIKNHIFIKGGHRLSGEEYSKTFHDILQNGSYI